MRSFRRCWVIVLVTALSWSACVVPAVTAGATVPAASVHRAIGERVVERVVQPAVEPVVEPAPANYVQGCPPRPAPGFNTCYSLRRNGFHSFSTRPDGYGPADLHAAYALPALTSTAGTGQTVYVIDAFGYPHAESDLAAYRAQYGLSPCTTANGCFRKLDQRGGKAYPRYHPGWAGETALDLDMVSAICPRCKITLIQADNNGTALFTAVDRANRLGARFVSMSWGGAEYGPESAHDLRYFNRTGVVYAASSGDSAYGVGVSYPATSRNTVAVGGTTLLRSGGARGWSDKVWNDAAGGYGTGSGCSDYLAKPAWQQIIASSVCGRRAGNDVAAVADPDTGVAVYQSGAPDGSWAVYGGTSASAPIIAAVYALAGAPAAADSPASYPYARANALNDVVAGRNGSCAHQLLCTAAAGWDGPTGLGTPHGLAAFRRPAQVIRLRNPGDQTSRVGSAVSLSLSATDLPAKPVSWTATGLPAGLSIITGTTSAGKTIGRIIGTPTANGIAMVTVTAADATGAAVSLRFRWTVGRPGTYVPLAGARLLDTRSGLGAPRAQLQSFHPRSVQVGGRGGVPAAGVSAVVLNVTATNPVGSGYLAVRAPGTSGTTNLNFGRRQTVAGLTVTRLSRSGAMEVVSSTRTDVLADVIGYYLAGTVADAGGFTPLVPARVLDTRHAIGAQAGKVRSGGSVNLQATGRGGVPGSGVGAVVLNVAAVAPTAPGYVTVYPDRVAKPYTSNLNFLTKQNVTNLVAARLAANGKVRLGVSGGSSDLVADVFGYFRAGAPKLAGAFGATTPARLFDTRTGRGFSGKPTALAGGSTTRIKVTGVGGVPPGGVSAVVLTLTAVGSTGSGYATLYADGSPKPRTSNLNYARQQTVANLVMVPVSRQGYIQLSVNASGRSGLFADVAGYYASGL